MTSSVSGPYMHAFPAGCFDVGENLNRFKAPPTWLKQNCFVSVYFTYGSRRLKSVKSERSDMCSGRPKTTHSHCQLHCAACVSVFRLKCQRISSFCFIKQLSPRFSICVQFLSFSSPSSLAPIVSSSATDRQRIEVHLPCDTGILSL